MKTTTLTLTPGGNIFVTTSIFGRNICSGRSAKVKEYFNANEPSSYQVTKVEDKICHLYIVTKVGRYPIAIKNHTIDLSLLPFNDNHKSDILTAILFSEQYEMICKVLNGMKN